MSGKGRSDPNLFGGYTHYDEKGHKIGSSTPGLFGGYVDYDSKGHKIGHTDPGLFGGYNHYDNHGRKLAVAILACLEATITMMRKETGQVPATQAHSGRIIIAMHRDAMLQPVCVDPMTVRRYGLCVVSGTTFWPEVALDELSYTPIMR